MKKIIKINDFEIEFELNKVAKQANASVLMKAGNTVMLASVAREESVVSEDFLPLTVSYVEKAYAAGKIPGGFIKRETKPNDFETLTSRIIDRTLRPLFPKGYSHPTHIVVMLLSVDYEHDIQPLALLAASAALSLSDVEIAHPAAGVRVGKKGENFVLNPSKSELANSTLDLFVSGVKDELLMIEMRSLGDDESLNEMSESELLDALEFAKKSIFDISTQFAAAFNEHKKTAKFDYKSDAENAEFAEIISKNYESDVKNAICKMAKSERASELAQVKDKIAAENNISEDDFAALDFELNRFKKALVRKQILEEGVRADGRKLNEVRPISIETNLLPMAHGSCLFTRGQTQALVVCTLGSEGDAQSQEITSNQNSSAENFMFNYNFPGFCVGEASPLKAPSRRELGHGNLAKRALAPSFKSEHTIRLVSEILESNGSSSMASVCGGSMALKAANVDVKKLIAGVAMGLMIEGEKYAVLTDIMGLEDHDGDMDFKVAGSSDGITAMQMDIKLGGVSTKILQEALERAKEGRLHILKLMQEASEKIVINEAVLPKIASLQVASNDIPEIIGQGGKTIKEIIERFGVAIDIDREQNTVKISGQNPQAAAEFIEQNLLKKRPKKPQHSYKIGDKLSGSVKSITKFGAFVVLDGGVDGLLHISKIKHLQLSEGDVLDVVVSELKNGKIALDLAE